MNIDFDRVQISVSRDELYCLYASLLAGLEHTAKTHWVNYPASFRQGEQMRIDMLRQITRFTGDDFEVDLKRISDIVGEALKIAEQQNRITKEEDVPF